MSAVSLSTCIPCSVPIDSVYANCIKSYQNEIQDLKRQLKESRNEISRNESHNETLSQCYTEMEHERDELIERVNVLERINHHINRQLAVHQKCSANISTRGTQTDVDVLLALETENKSLKAQIRQLLTMAHETLDSQQRLVAKYKSKSTKLDRLRAELSSATQQIKEANEKQEISNDRIAKLSAKKSRLKTENRRLTLRLTETEGNLTESESTNSRLRHVLSTVNDKEELKHSQTIIDVSKRLFEAETRLREAEMKAAESLQLKKDLQETSEKLEQSKVQCKQLAETLRQTQTFLMESKRQLTEGVVAEENEQQLNKMTAKYEQTSAETKRLQARIGELEGEVATLRHSDSGKEVARLRNLYSNLLKQVSSTPGHSELITELQLQVDTAEARNHELEQMLEHHKSEEESLNISEQLDYLLTENRKLREQIDAIENGPMSPSKMMAMNKELGKQLRQKNKENESLIKQVELLLEEKSELEGQLLNSRS